MDLKAYQQRIAQFAKERDWDQFHSPKNLSMALAVEAGELMEIFQWMTEEKSIEIDGEDYELIKEELADIFHNVPQEMHGYGIWDLPSFVESLRKYREKHGGTNYISYLNEIFGGDLMQAG